MTNSFYDQDTSGHSDTDNGTPTTTAAMKDSFTFSDAGWDFITVWGKSRTGENDVYMILRAMNDTGYDYYVRLSDTNTAKTYSDANPSLGAITLDGIGEENVSLGWGGAITATTNVGTYAYSSDNVLDLAFSVGSSADYYINYGAGALTVAPRVISLSGSRTYDGTTTVAASALTTFANLAGGETVILTGGGTAADQNAGSGTRPSRSTRWPLAMARGWPPTIPLPAAPMSWTSPRLP